VANDVLVILDGEGNYQFREKERPRRTFGGGKYEILLGQPAGHEAAEHESSPFMRALCTALEELQKDTFNTYALFDNLLNNKNSPCNALWLGCSELRESIEIGASIPRSHSASGILVPTGRSILLKTILIPSALGVDSQPWKQWIKWQLPKNVTKIHASIVENSKDFAFNLDVTLASSAIPDVTSWNEWIDRAPGNVQSIVCDIKQSDSSDEDTLATFVAQLNFKHGINESLGVRYYNSVTVLPIMWDEPADAYMHADDAERNLEELKDIHDELSAISEVFGEERFNFNVQQILRLPHEAHGHDEASDALDDRIHGLIKNFGRQSKSLIIVVYGGHGAETRISYEKHPDEGHCIWAA
jgi:hypothetical protein